MSVHLSPISANSKTGMIPVSTSTKDWCPDSCPFKKGGCYARLGHLNLHWHKVSTGQRGTDWETFCQEIKRLPKHQLWRHNQAGDLPKVDGELIDREKLDALVKANRGKRGFTYTHHDMTKPENREAVKDAVANGFIVNVSANNTRHADELANQGLWPIVVVVPSDTTGKVKTPEGRPVVLCPVYKDENMDCQRCQLCANSKRKSIVGFPAHGKSFKKVDAIARVE